MEKQKEGLLSTLVRHWNQISFAAPFALKTCFFINAHQYFYLVMRGLRFKRYVNFVSLIAILALVISKSLLRPWARENEAHEVLIIILNSIPNFLEPLVGVPAVTGILFMLRHSQAKWLLRFSDRGIYFLSIFLATLYVTSQELKIHSIGGNNVYDPNDLIASILGLIFMLGIMLRFGFLREQVADSQGLQN